MEDNRNQTNAFAANQNAQQQNGAFSEDSGQNSAGQAGYKQQNSGQSAGGYRYQKGPVGTMRSPLTVLLLSIVTCGIYGIVWMYQISEEINLYTRARLTEPHYSWAGIFCGVFTFINMYKLDQAIVQIDRVEGRNSDSKFLFWLLLSVFFGLGFLMMIYQVQEGLNRIWAANGGSYQSNQF